jgi:hypothetical protein
MNATINDIDWDFLTWIENEKADELWQTAQQFTPAERLALYHFLEAVLAPANS